MKKVTLDDGEVVSAAEQAAAIVEGTGKSEYIGMTKVISVRIPVFLLLHLQALAHKSSKTRNATICTLLEVGLEEVEQRLSTETRAEISQIHGELIEQEFNLSEEDK